MSRHGPIWRKRGGKAYWGRVKYRPSVCGTPAEPPVMVPDEIEPERAARPALQVEDCTLPDFGFDGRPRTGHADDPLLDRLRKVHGRPRFDLPRELTRGKNVGGVE